MDDRTLARYANSPAEFRNELLVDVDGIARPFGTVIDGWQEKDFEALDDGLKIAAGRLHPDYLSFKNKEAENGERIFQRAYIERPRGHSKTTDLAVICTWAMAFASRPLKGFCFAADKEQAALLKEAVHTLVRCNPWLGELISVQKDSVVNIMEGHPAQGARLTINASDVGSSYGILPDLIIADELCHWQGDGALWHSLLTSSAKRQTCLLVVISNAGFVDSWQWRVREAARVDEAWFFSRLDGPQASWMTDERLAEQRRMLPGVAFNRLWLNEWSSGGGDALTQADIDAAFLQDRRPMTGKEKGYRFVAGLDLGLTRDCSAAVVLAIPEGGKAGRIRLAHTKLWRPVLGKKIDLTAVENYIVDLDRQYNLEFVGFDPWQAELMAQRLEVLSSRRRRKRQGGSSRELGNRANQPAWLQPFPSTGPNLRSIASLTIESFNDRRLELYPEDNLKRDLEKLRVEEKSYGYRLTSPRDELGHGDTFSAFAIALKLAHELAGKKTVIAGAISLNGRGNYKDVDVNKMVADAIQYKEDREAEMNRQDTYDNNHEWRQMMRAFGRA